MTPPMNATEWHFGSFNRYYGAGIHETFFSSWNVVVRQVVDEVAIAIPPVTCHATGSCVASYEVSTFAAVVG